MIKKAKWIIGILLSLIVSMMSMAQEAFVAEFNYEATASLTITFTLS